MNAKSNALIIATKPSTLKPSMATLGLIQTWVEIWDYVGDVRFRGFVGGTGFLRSLFIFIRQEMIGKEMKPGYESHLVDQLCFD